MNEELDYEERARRRFGAQVRDSISSAERLRCEALARAACERAYGSSSPALYELGRLYEDIKNGVDPKEESCQE